MSRKNYKAAVEAAMRENKALPVLEPAVKVGKGDKTYKTLTAAVKAAEKAKEDSRAAAASARHAASEAGAAWMAAKAQQAKLERLMMIWYACATGLLVFLILTCAL